MIETKYLGTIYNLTPRLFDDLIHFKNAQDESNSDELIISFNYNDAQYLTNLIDKLYSNFLSNDDVFNYMSYIFDEGPVNDEHKEVLDIAQKYITEKQVSLHFKNNKK
ncbi:hypothetical protein N8069_04900 [Flavobacteriaceae bacterium]|nr:hypothetical protein [Flavobacteriaceae bacterium]